MMRKMYRYIYNLIKSTCIAWAKKLSKVKINWSGNNVQGLTAVLDPQLPKNQNII